MAPAAIRVLLADDRPALDQELTESFGRDAGIDLVGHARDEAETHALVSEHAPELVVLDVSSADLGGVDALRRIRSDAPGTRVLALLATREPEEVRGVAGSGAEGYLVAEDTTPEIVRMLVRLPPG